MSEVLECLGRCSPFGMSGVVDPTNTLLAIMCYLTKFSRFRSNCLGIDGVPKTFGDAGTLPPWDGDVADPLEMCFSPLVLPC